MLAMAPQTNIGSSTPIDVGGGEHPERPPAQGRSTTPPRRCAALAATHGRNVDWADAGRPQASNLTAREALAAERHRRRRADAAGAARTRSTAAKTRAEGLRPAHGRRRGRRPSHMSLLEAHPRHADRPEPHLAPALARRRSGIIVELLHPGLIFPATFGALCLVDRASSASQVLPISWAGLAADARRVRVLGRRALRPVSHGALTLAGAVASSSARCCSSSRPAPATRSRCRSSLAIAERSSLLLRVRARRRSSQVRRRPARSARSTMVGEHGEVAPRRARLRARRALAGARRPTASRSSAGDEVDVVGVERASRSSSARRAPGS